MNRQPSKPMIDSDIGHVVQNMEKIAQRARSPFAGGIPGSYVRPGTFGTNISEEDEGIQDRYSHDDKMNPVGEQGGGLKKFGSTYVPRADVYHGPAHGHVVDGVCFTDDPQSQQQVPVPSPFRHIKNSRNSSGSQKTAADDSKPGTAGVGKRGPEGSGAVSGSFRPRLKPRVRPTNLRTMRRIGAPQKQETAPMKQVLQDAPTQASPPSPATTDPNILLAALATTPEGRAMMAAYAGAAAAPEGHAPEPVEAPAPAPAPPPASQMKTAEKLDILPPRAVEEHSRPTAEPPKLASNIQVEFDVQGMGKLRFKVHDIQVESEIVIISQDPESSFSPPSGSYLNLKVLEDGGHDYLSKDTTFSNLGFPGIEFQPKGIGILYQVYLITPPAAAE